MDPLDLLKAYEAWEGDIIANGDWGQDGMHPYPRLTESQYDEMLRLQAERNVVLPKSPEAINAELLAIAEEYVYQCDDRFYDPEEMTPESAQLYRDAKAAIEKAKAATVK